MDALAVSAALLLSFRLREANIDLVPRVQLLDPSHTLPSMNAYLSSFVTPGVFLFVIVAALLGLYALRTTASAWREIGSIIVAALLWLIAVIAWYFLVERELFYSRILLAHAAFFIILFVTLGRSAVVLLQRALLRCGIGIRLVISVGALPIAAIARDVLARDIRYEYLGHVPDLDSLRSIRARCTPDLVIQTDPSPQSEMTMQIIEDCRSHHIGYAFLPPVFADVPHLLEVRHLGLVPMLQFMPTPLDGWGRVLKRLFDLVMSIVLLVVLSPLLLLLALGIVITSGLPIFYVSRRVGEHGKAKISALKFRSMIRNADEKKAELLTKNERSDGPLFKLHSDPRITPFGRFLRRFDLDELPQLFNVLIGQMSLVGPRPHLPEEVSRYAPRERRVFAVKPGITGLAQISGRSDLLFQEEVRLDLRYIEEWSPLMDLWILWRTIFVVLGRRSRL
jgi:exopolysaccharide biosynthesis polyprenyl glycosylphosphotransferase